MNLLDLQAAFTRMLAMPKPVVTVVRFNQSAFYGVVVFQLCCSKHISRRNTSANTNYYPVDLTDTRQCLALSLAWLYLILGYALSSLLS